MRQSKLAQPQFQTPAHCASGECVGVARLSNGSFAVKNTGTTTRPVTFTRAEWEAFITAVKAGEYNL